MQFLKKRPLMWLPFPAFEVRVLLCVNFITFGLQHVRKNKYLQRVIICLVEFTFGSRQAENFSYNVTPPFFKKFTAPKNPRFLFNLHNEECILYQPNCCLENGTNKMQNGQKLHEFDDRATKLRARPDLDGLLALRSALLAFLQALKLM